MPRRQKTKEDSGLVYDCHAYLDRRWSEITARFEGAAPDDPENPLGDDHALAPLIRDCLRSSVLSYPALGQQPGQAGLRHRRAGRGADAADFSDGGKGLRLCARLAMTRQRPAPGVLPCALSFVAWDLVTMLRCKTSEVSLLEVLR